MKIRNGFVSNSSSSSFVILGVPKNGDYDELMENDNFPDGIDAVYVESSGYDYVIGYTLTDGEDYLDETSTSLSELKEMAQKVADYLKVDISDVQLITGTRPS